VRTDILTDVQEPGHLDSSDETVEVARHGVIAEFVHVLPPSLAE
jgi:hypothetical protein